jgi:MoxR-like ATPase
MIQPWHIFTGNREPHAEVLPPAPPWRTFGTDTASPAATGKNEAAPVLGPAIDDAYWARARSYRAPSAILDGVNAALALRRPLLVTGSPGTGKSTLAYRVAYELGLGPVLVWPVNSRSTLKEGLYDYDAIARLHERQLRGADSDGKQDNAHIGDFITLRALGTALLPQARPRVLLIDELDKADPDLPNDLLNVFEEGWFDIPELQRCNQQSVDVRTTNPWAKTTADRSSATVRNGRVQCSSFPFIVVTSNGEREFPPAFLRRCIRVDLPDPDELQLTAIVRAHLGEDVAEKAAARIKEFATGERGSMATDQLLNALHIIHGVNGLQGNSAAAASVDAMLTQKLF